MALQSQPPALPGTSGARFYFFSLQRENPGSCLICQSMYILCPSYTLVPVLDASMRVFLFACAVADGGVRGGCKPQ